MPADYTELDASLLELLAVVTETEGVQASATALLNGVTTIVQNAVSKALDDDNAVDAAAAAAAKAAVAGAIARLRASKNPLAAAVAAVPKPQPPPPPPPPPPPVTG